MVRLATENSKQHHKTPDEFMAAIGRRFGEVVFDLAADRTNFRHKRYFAPLQFNEIYDPSKISSASFIDSLAARGADAAEVKEVMARAIGNAEAEAMMGSRKAKKAKVGKYEILVPNHDAGVVAKDSFKQMWASLTKKHGGFLFLNPEFKNIDPWADKCRTEGLLGADILFLVPAAVGANWFLEHVYGRADRCYLNGRISFIPGEPYMKDCMLARFWPGMAGREFVWNWRDDVLHATRFPPECRVEGEPTLSAMKMSNEEIRVIP